MITLTSYTFPKGSPLCGAATYIEVYSWEIHGGSSPTFNEPGYPTEVYANDAKLFIESMLPDGSGGYKDYEVGSIDAIELIETNKELYEEFGQEVSEYERDQIDYAADRKMDEEREMAW